MVLADTDRSMNPIELVRGYLDAATPGNIQFDKVRTYLADDYRVKDPLMTVQGADAFVEQLRQVSQGGGPEMRTTVEAVVGADDIVVALTRFEMGPVKVTFSQWFWVKGDKIQHSEVIYDPRPFLELRGSQ